MTLKPPRSVLLVIVAVEVVAAAFAWRDLNRRSDGQVRGNKKAWRAFIAMNPGNAIVYWLAGRR
jgi:hypothetical protein